jgi:hypothetical protein
MRFAQPYYVSPHAVQRFRQYVADLPDKTIRTIIQATMQDQKQRVTVQVYDHDPCPIYKAKYRGIEYLIPVQRDKKKTNAWPVVPTILLPWMRTGRIIGERSGWNW